MREMNVTLIFKHTKVLYPLNVRKSQKYECKKRWQLNKNIIIFIEKGYDLPDI